MSEIDGGYPREPSLTLGKASLRVFCAHRFFVFAAVALLYGDIPELHGFRAYGMALTFTGLFLVASREVKLKKGAADGCSCRRAGFHHGELIVS